MKKLFYTLPILIVAIALSSCNFKDETEVTLKNSTEKPITFTSFSESVDSDLPLTIAAGSESKVSYDSGAEDVTFKLTYDGKSYSGSTNYVQDYSEYTLTVYLDGSTLKNKVNSGTAYTLKEEN